MKPIIIIEHLEPKLWPWCKIEYESISKLIQKKNVWFTNISDGKEALQKLGRVLSQSVINMPLQNACILDPNAKKTLTPQEAKQFDYFIIGGILGDNPPKARTKVELTHKLKHAQSRNMGNKQFSTDNAVYVLKHIIQGTPIRKMKFQNGLTIKINTIESIDLPYYYPIVHYKPRISPKLIEYLKKKKGF